MSDSADEKPIVKWKSTIDVESANHDKVRLRKWAFRDSAAIQELCDEKLEPRQFVNRLISQQAVEPPLPAEELEKWTDHDIIAAAAAWWQAVKGQSTSPLAVDSLDGFQVAVRQRSDEQTQKLNSISIGLQNVNLRFPGMNSLERLARDLEKQNSLFDSRGLHSFHKALQHMDLAASHSAVMDKFQALNLLNPDRLAFASIQERMREASLLSLPAISDFTRLAQSTVATELSRRAGELAQQMDQRFRGFESLQDTNRIADALRSLDSSAYGRFLPDFKGLESVLSKFSTASIDRLYPDASIVGIARMTAMTAAANAAKPFELSSVSALREMLGDWREVKMPWRFLPDTNLREKFYIDRGFDTSLIQLPEPAFTHALETVGLVRPPLVHSDADIEEIDEEELLRQRMSQIYKLLFRLERGLRNFIDRVMIEKYGTDWERHRCHGNGKIHDTWVQKREKAIQNGLQPERLIQYADFTEYADLITKADNWKDVFKSVFDRPDSVRESFFRLGPVRLCTMHARPITKTELMLATAEITRLLIAIGDSEKD